MSKENKHAPEEQERYEGILGDFEENAAEEAEQAAEKTAGNDEKPKKKGSKKPLVAAGAAVAACAVLGGGGVLGYNLWKNAQVKTALSTEHYSVTDKGVASYYYLLAESVVSDIESTYGTGAAVTYFGLDTSVSLRDQSYDETQSWHDVILEYARSGISEQLVLCEAANAAGYTLSEAEQADLDNTVALRMSTVNAHDASLTEADLRSVYEIEYLSNAYYNSVLDSFTATDEELEAYYQANKLSMDTVTIAAYPVSYAVDGEDAADDAAEEETAEEETAAAEDTEDAGDDETEEEETAEPRTLTKAEADALVADLRASKTAEEFESKVIAVMTDVDGYAQEAAEAAISSIYNTWPYYEGYDLMEWAFGGAQAGDTFIEEGDGATYVYYLVSAPSRDESASTVNVRHILFMNADDNMAAAEDALAEWESGDRSEESFAALANQYSEDPGSNTNGGLYEDVYPGQMVTTFNDWCFDPSRKAGDTGIVVTDYGVHVMYFSAAGDIAWRAAASAAVEQEKYDAWLAEQKTLYPVTADENVLAAIG